MDISASHWHATCFQLCIRCSPGKTPARIPCLGASVSSSHDVTCSDVRRRSEACGCCKGRLLLQPPLQPIQAPPSQNTAHSCGSRICSTQCTSNLSLFVSSCHTGMSRTHLRSRARGRCSGGSAHEDDIYLLSSEQYPETSEAFPKSAAAAKICSVSGGRHNRHRRSAYCSRPGLALEIFQSCVLAPTGLRLSLIHI